MFSHLLAISILAIYAACLAFGLPPWPTHVGFATAMGLWGAHTARRSHSPIPLMGVLGLVSVVGPAMAGHADRGFGTISHMVSAGLAASLFTSWVSLTSLVFLLFDWINSAPRAGGMIFLGIQGFAVTHALFPETSLAHRAAAGCAFVSLAGMNLLEVSRCRHLPKVWLAAWALAELAALAQVGHACVGARRASCARCEWPIALLMISFPIYACAQRRETDRAIDPRTAGEDFTVTV